jgi:hypothetical protein
MRAELPCLGPHATSTDSAGISYRNDGKGFTAITGKVENT